MTKARWRKIITESAKNVGTYRESFDGVIKTLAEILETRDTCQKQFEEAGSHPVITKINVKGDEVIVRNPMLETIITLNTQALSYWRDLGLTPSGLKKINDQMAAKQKRGLSDMVADLLKEE